MRLARFNLMALLFAMSASAAFGDLARPVLPAAQRIPVAARDGYATDFHRTSTALDLWPGSANNEHALAFAQSHGDSDAVVREIRKSPSSLSLYLSVLIGVGGWHFVRSARHLGAVVAPEWYHTGGPVQVGHVTPLDLSFATPPLCCFEQPVAHQSLLHRIRLDRGPRLESQTYLLLAAPRGPPLSA